MCASTALSWRAVLLLVAAACAPASSSAPGFSVRDSAGITIVESSDPAWSEGRGWQVSSTILLDVGSPDGDPSYLLSQVMGVLRMDDGGVVVANMGDQSVRRYDANGQFVWSAGRQGEGPGEFRQLWQIQRTVDGILAAPSNPFQPAYVFGSDGRLVRTIAKQGTPAGRVVGFDHMFPDGSYLAYDWPQGYPVKGDLWTDSASIFRLSPDAASLDSLIRLPAARFARVDARRGDYIRFGPRLMNEVSDDAIYATFPDDYDIGVYDLTGRLVRRIRRAWTPRPVTDSEIEAYKQHYMNLPGEDGREAPPDMRERIARIMASATFAEQHAAHGPMLVDQVGNLWVQREIERTGGTYGFHPVFDEPTEWDVFDTRGVWLGLVPTPKRFAVFEIGNDYVAGVWRDEVDVEHVRVYLLEK